MIGTTISHYKIIEKLGAGGMGEVFLAEDTKLDRKVALKFLPSSLWNEAEAQQRLIREAKSASKLDHPNIVTIHGLEEHEGRPYIIMAHVPGSTLKEYCTASHRSTEHLLDLVVQMANGLQHAHDSGVVHRDLKPSNVIVDDTGRARILDFGIASLRGAAKLTQTGSTIGTIAYAPPELAQGKKATPASDVYSLGVVTYQMLSGKLPFEADHEAALLYSILHDDPKPLSESNPDVKPELENIVARCLEKDPAKRFATCAELSGELKNILAPAPQSLSEEKSTPSIAILPFANMSADPENEFFADGLTEELLNVLARNPELKVTARTSSFAFKGKQVDLREIGQKLGVEHILEGSVRKAGNRVRITAQLVKVSDGFHTWSDTFDHVLDDIFAIQDSIADSVSKAMNVTLLGKSVPRSKGNPETLGLVVQANHFTTRYTKESVAKAIELCGQALAIDPEDARAWSGLANAYLVQEAYGLCDKSGLDYERVRDAAQKALALDDSIPGTWGTIAWLQIVVDLDWNKAEESFRKALALAPGDVGALIGVATFESLAKNFGESQRLLRKAVELDPLNSESLLQMARTYFFAEQYAEARNYYCDALSLSPGITTAHANFGLTLVLEGRAEEGFKEIKKEHNPGYRSFGLAIAFHALDRPTESDQALGELVALGEKWSHQIASVHSYRGEIDEAFASLERAYELRDAGLTTTAIAPYYKPLHSDPRWPVFLKKIGLTH